MSAAARTARADGRGVIEPLGEQVGEGREIAPRRILDLPVVIAHLDIGAEADGDEEGDDEGGNGAAEKSLGNQQPMIGGFRNRLRQSLDRIGLDACMFSMRTRHAVPPWKFPGIAPSPPARPRRRLDANQQMVK